MSKTFYVAVGGLLLLIGAVAAFVAVDGGVARPDRAYGIAAAFGALGFVLLVVGLLNPIPAAHRRYLTRKLTPWNLVAGPAIIGAGIGVLYLFTQVFHVMPKIVVIGALLAIPVGVFVTASVFGDACARCDRLLETKTLRFVGFAAGVLERLRSGDVASALAALGETTPEGSARLEVGYCATCRSVALYRIDSQTVVVREHQAKLLADRARRA